MVVLVKKNVKGTTYYYLRHSYREGRHIKFIDKSLGKDKNEVRSENLRRHKEEFVKIIFSKLWVKKIEDIKEKYQSKFLKLDDIYKKNYIRDFGIRFTYNTNKIEGSTLNLRETAITIDHPDTPINKPVRDVNEIQLHWQCFDDMTNTNEELSLDLVFKWHKILFTLSKEMRKEAGKYRTGAVGVSGSKQVFPDYHEVPYLIDDLFNWYDENKGNTHSVLLSCLMHRRFVAIHPFADGNGRMSRLIMNYILYRSKYPMFDIPAKVRVSYFKSLERAYLKEDEMVFVGWFMRNYIKYVNNI